jgi:addiction module HigA family antidote
MNAESKTLSSPPHPGQVLRDRIRVHDLSAFAARVGVSRVSVSRLVHGQNGISAQMALSLAEILGTTAEYWMKLQMDYDLWHAAEDRREAMLQRKHLTRHIGAITFLSKTRPGRTVRITHFPSEISANKRNMNEDTTKEPKLDFATE